MKDTAGKLVVPAVVAAGSALGYLLTKKQDGRAAAPKVRDRVSDLPRPHLPARGVGDLADELRGKVESVLGKAPSGSASSTASIDQPELQARRRERQERRNQRRQRSRR